MTLFVKLCGIRTEADLDAAVEAGADAVGFVLTPSPRQVPLSVAACLKAKLPASVLGVAVFHDPTPDLLVRAREEVGPDLFQSELSTLIGISPDRLLPVVVDGESLARDFAVAVSSTVREMVLVDSAARGGTGSAASWERLAELNGPGRLILAGGLNPDNVGAAVSLVRPFGVDVSSGIEKSPGEKDPKRMQAFVDAARKGATVSPPEGGKTAAPSGPVSPPGGGSTAEGGEGGPLGHLPQRRFPPGGGNGGEGGNS
jgi:phosphoribosylanthranilate isomerase